MKNIIWLDRSYYDDSDDDSDDDDDSGGGNDNNDYENNKIIRKIPQILTTPLGIFRTNQAFGNPYSDNEVWQASVNFDITKECSDIIESVQGVEGLRIISRYTFVICVGMLFDSESVKYEIEKSLGIENVKIDNVEETLNIPKNLERSLKTEISRVSSMSDYWYVYLFPNGEITSLVLKNQEEYDKNLNYFLQMKRLSCGLLLSGRGKINE